MQNSIVPSFDLRVGMNEVFMAKLAIALHECAEKGVIMHPYFGLRNPVRQAKLWRQSRTLHEIGVKIDYLNASGCPYLAECIDAAGSQTGPWATNAIPGYSWHQWGVAMDCVWVRGGKPCWDLEFDGSANGYKIYAMMGEKVGLTSLIHMGDADHLQLFKEGAPDHAHSAKQINDTMRAKFGDPHLLA